MNKKILKFIALVGLIGLICPVWQAMAQFSTSTQESIENLKDSLTEDAKDYAKDQVDAATQVIGNEVSEATQSILRRIPGKALEMLKTVSKKVLNLVKGSVNGDVKQWFSNRKDAVVEGLKEEKEEFGGDAKAILSGIWEKIKDVFRREESEENDN